MLPAASAASGTSSAPVASASVTTPPASASSHGPAAAPAKAPLAEAPSSASVDAILAAKAGDLGDCAGSARGTVVVRLHIAPSGSALVDFDTGPAGGTIRGKSERACISMVLEDAKFDPSRGGASTERTLTFPQK